MNLRIFFDPVTDMESADVFEPHLLIHSLSINNGTFPDWKNAKVAIIGVTECRGTSSKKLDQGPHLIRTKLYSLSKGSTSQMRIVDLGNLRNGITLLDTKNRLKEVVEILLQNNIFPLIIGGGHDMDLALFQGYEFMNKSISMLNVDAYFDLNSTDVFGENKHHIHKIITHSSPSLYHYAHLGYQSYLTDNDSIQALEKMHFEIYRVGRVKEKLQEMEPVIRTADFLSFDISSIKLSDAPGNTCGVPFGLSGEEACQICWYGGLSPKLTSAGIFEYNPHLDNREQTAFLIATMVWYLLEGIATRLQNENGFEKRIKYIVSMKQKPHQLIFYKEPNTEKWWMEVPILKKNDEAEEISIVPCSYSDYELANQGELPYRWILTQAKLN